MTPEVWLQLGAHPGDNAQIATLGDLLKRRFGWDVKAPDTQDLRRSHWPDLLIGAGYRNVSTALEIKERAEDRTKLVRIGRPRLPYHLFDLIITTRQYGLSKADNVVLLSVPLASLEEPNGPSLLEGIELPRPWFVMVVGGPTQTNKFGKNEVATFLSQSFDKINRARGSALIITSPRTPEFLKEMLEKGEKGWPPHKVWYWGKNMPNPYTELLNECDFVISTGDSASIAADVLRRGKPLFLASPVPKKNRHIRESFWNNRAKRFNENSQNLLDHMIDFGIARGLLVPHRNMKWFHDHLKNLGLAAPLSGEIAPTPNISILEREVNQLLARIKNLFPGM